MSVDHDVAARVADDPGHDPERRVRSREHRALLDVELEERTRKGPAGRDERAAPDAADLLAAEHDDGARSDALDGLDRGHDAQRAVEATPLWNAVEV